MYCWLQLWKGPSWHWAKADIGGSLSMFSLSAVSPPLPQSPLFPDLWLTEGSRLHFGAVFFPDLSFMASGITSQSPFRSLSQMSTSCTQKPTTGLSHPKPTVSQIEPHSALYPKPSVFPTGKAIPVNDNHTASFLGSKS